MNKIIKILAIKLAIAVFAILVASLGLTTLDVSRDISFWRMSGGITLLYTSFTILQLAISEEISIL